MFGQNCARIEDRSRVPLRPRGHRTGGPRAPGRFRPLVVPESRPERTPSSSKHCVPSCVNVTTLPTTYNVVKHLGHTDPLTWLPARHADSMGVSKRPGNCWETASLTGAALSNTSLVGY